ncbi:MAG: hypothetical protein HXX13_00035 [Bacteroidetes bacterium]|nr:hypothetical protein [Bacteroidota bacterium]
MLTRLIITGWIIAFSVLLSAQNAPVTYAANIFNAVPGTITVPVTVTGFTSIGAFSLDLQYDPSIISYVQATKNAVLTGSFMIGDNVLSNGMHHLVISWFGPSKSLNDGSSLVDLKFNFLSGTTNLAWMDDGSSCEYADYAFNALNDLPGACYYRHGIVTDNKCLDLSVLIQGLYNTTTHKMKSAVANCSGMEDAMADNIQVELHNAANYSTVELTRPVVDLSLAGLAKVPVPLSMNSSYYITVRYRNAVAITSSTPVSINTSGAAYNFTDLSSRAFNNSMVQMSDGKWAMYSGDVNQDGLVDFSDMILVDNDAVASLVGYLPTDCNGDGLVNNLDMILVGTNAQAFVAQAHP